MCLSFLIRILIWLLPYVIMQKKTAHFFSGKVKKRFHIGFEDPANFQGNYEEKLNKFRVIRDEIKKKFYELYKNEIIKKL